MLRTTRLRVKRVYTSGFEHHPVYNPEANRRRILERGVKLPTARASTAPSNSTGGAGPVDQPRADTRFFRKAADFRELQDNDPYRDLFGERRSFVRSKVGAWRAQFEKENEDVELPYERTGFIARTAPNWFVRWMVGVRENQGMDLLYLPACFVFAVIVMTLWNNATVLPMGKTKDVREMK